MNNFSDSLLTLKGIYYYRTFLKHSERFTPSELEICKRSWLKRILLHSYRKIPFWTKRFRECSLNPLSEDPLTELAKLPVLTKDEVRANHSELCEPQVQNTSLKFYTSGTTGQPLVSYTSSRQWVNEQGVIWRSWRNAGYAFRDKVAIFRSYAPKAGEPRIKLDRLRNWAYFSVFDMSDEDLFQYSKYLARWKPRFLRGYPSSLHLVASHAIRNNWALPTLSGAFTASEELDDETRALVKRAFGVDIWDHYGQAEITCMFHDCERHSGMHVDWEYGHVELLQAESPDLFRIIATNLHNTAMPLLRYDTGDLAQGNFQRCDCNRPSLKIKAIVGRKDGFAIAADGSKFSTVNLYTIMSKFPEIRQFQFRQPKAGELTLTLSFWTDTPHTSAAQEKILATLNEKCPLKISVLTDINFKRSREGKFLAFLSEI